MGVGVGVGVGVGAWGEMTPHLELAGRGEQEVRQRGRRCVYVIVETRLASAGGMKARMQRGHPILPMHAHITSPPHHPTTQTRAYTCTRPAHSPKH